jgi:hypothetical protein
MGIRDVSYHGWKVLDTLRGNPSFAAGVASIYYSIALSRKYHIRLWLRKYYSWFWWPVIMEC